VASRQAASTFVSCLIHKLFGLKAAALTESTEFFCLNRDDIPHPHPLLFTPHRPISSHGRRSVLHAGARRIPAIIPA
jgi:hypothetical protein